MNNQFVYLDHAATTSLRPQVLEAWIIKNYVWRRKYTRRCRLFNGITSSDCGKE